MVSDLADLMSSMVVHLRCLNDSLDQGLIDRGPDYPVTIMTGL